MKDKRNILKIAAILQFLYVCIIIFYSLMFIKNSDEKLANIFLNIINFGFGIILYKLSGKEIEYFKNNKLLLYITSFWLLLDSFIPGVLGIYFLKSISEKKELRLPDVSESNVSAAEKVKSIVLLSLFLVFMFVFPKFSFFIKIPVLFSYIIIILLVLILNFSELKYQFSIFIKNIKLYLPYVIKSYFKMLGLMLIVAVHIVLINNGNTSNNQTSINLMFKENAIFTILLTCLYAPFVEEVLFRFNLSKLIKNKKMFIIISGFVFGLLHVIGKFNNLYEFLFIFQYSALGIYLAKTYKDSNNIFVTISMHFIQNFLASMLILLLY